MAKLYDLNKEAAPGEVTQSLARSLKNGLFAPTEKRFSSMEKEIAALKQAIELDTQKLSLEVNEKFNNLEKEFVLLKKLFRISTALSITCLVGVTVTLIFLFYWY